MKLSNILPNFTGVTISQGILRLQLIEKIGSGAYGVVYLAQDLSPLAISTALFFAVKCQHRHPDGFELANQHQRDIANHLAVADVPGVLGIHAVIEDQFYTYTVLDYCLGGDLFSAITTRKAYVKNTPAIKRTFLQIINAVDACHQRGIYHRDLKPENILCSGDDQLVFLSDFGLSTRSTKSFSFGCGSSSYMSPECLGLFSHSPYQTGPSDVWSLGVIFCNLVTGRNPWHVASPAIDMGFRTYLQQGNLWLLDNLPISLSTANILRRIFTVDPALRITLPQLRTEITQLGSFFPPAATLPPFTHAFNKLKPATPAKPQRSSAGAIRGAPYAGSHPMFPPSGSQISTGDVLRYPHLFPRSPPPPTPAPAPAPASQHELSPANPNRLSLSAGSTATCINMSPSSSASSSASHESRSFISHPSEALDLWHSFSSGPGSEPASAPHTPATASDSGAESGDSAGPITPETVPLGDGAPAEAVPELNLDAHAPVPVPHSPEIVSLVSQSIDNETASLLPGAVAAVSPSLPLETSLVAQEEVKAKDKDVRKKRRGSLSRFVDGVKRICVRAPRA